MSVIGTNLVGKRVKIVAGARGELIGERGYIAAVYMVNIEGEDNLMLALGMTEKGQTGNIRIIDGFFTNSVILTDR